MSNWLHLTNQSLKEAEKQVAGVKVHIRKLRRDCAVVKEKVEGLKLKVCSTDHEWPVALQLTLKFLCSLEVLLLSEFRISAVNHCTS